MKGIARVVMVGEVRIPILSVPNALIPRADQCTTPWAVVAWIREGVLLGHILPARPFLAHYKGVKWHLDRSV